MEIALFIPPDLPLSLLTHPQFKESYECGYIEGEPEETWTVPQLVNQIYLTLYEALQDECSLASCAWAVGFLLGTLAWLAESESILALVGIAHLCFLLSWVSRETSPLGRNLMQLRHYHQHAIRAYRARVRSYRTLGKSFAEAQRLALVESL